MEKGGRVTGAAGVRVGEQWDALRVGARAGSMGGCGH